MNRDRRIWPWRRGTSLATPNVTPVHLSHRMLAHAICRHRSRPRHVLPRLALPIQPNGGARAFLDTAPISLRTNKPDTRTPSHPRPAPSEAMQRPHCLTPVTGPPTTVKAQCPPTSDPRRRRAPVGTGLLYTVISHHAVVLGQEAAGRFRPVPVSRDDASHNRRASSLSRAVSLAWTRVG